MSRWWAKVTAGRAGAAGGDAGKLRVPGAPAAETSTTEAPEVIDLTERPTWSERAEPDPQKAAEIAERFRARRARVEAQRELQRLRDRHWSGERVLEEGRTTIEWWEHPEADPFAVLGLLPGARLEDAAAARRRIAHECHPDRIDTMTTDPDEALRRMVAANAAYDRLRRALRPVL
jgi:hypothetical protein